MCVYAYVLVYVCARRGTGSSGGVNYRWLLAAWWRCPALNLGPLEEQQGLLTTEPFLQPNDGILLCTRILPRSWLYFFCLFSLSWSCLLNLLLSGLASDFQCFCWPWEFWGRFVWDFVAYPTIGNLVYNYYVYIILILHMTSLRRWFDSRGRSQRWSIIPSTVWRLHTSNPICHFCHNQVALHALFLKCALWKEACTAHNMGQRLGRLHLYRLYINYLKFCTGGLFLLH